MTPRRLVTIMLVSALALAACGGGSSDEHTSLGKDEVAITTIPALRTTLRAITDAYQAQHPDAHITVSTASDPSEVRGALDDGSSNVAVVAKAWLGSPGGDLGNVEGLIPVANGNPHGVKGPEVFAASSGLRTKVCAERSSVGSFGSLVLDKSDVRPASGTVDDSATCSTSAVADVAAGRLDAALVFPSGTPIPEAVQLVRIPPDANVVIPLAYQVDTGSSAGVDFGAFLASEPVHQILADRGYLA